MTTAMRSAFSFLLVMVVVGAPFIARADSAVLIISGTSSSSANSIRDELKSEQAARLKAIQDYKATLGSSSEGAKLVAAKTVANALINERLSALDKAVNQLSARSCSQTAKTDATAASATIVDGLKNAKSEILAATTLNAVKIIVSGTVGKSQVFTAELPALRGLCTADAITVVVDHVASGALVTLKTAGLDTSELEKDLTQTKIAAQSAYQLYLAVAVNPGTTTTKKSLTTANTKLGQARGDLAGVAADLQRLSKS